MPLKKSLLLAGTAATLGLATVSFGVASAMHDTGEAGSLATKIAQKFNLKDTEVQAVIDEAHEARKAEMHARMEERLDKAVADGKLTEDQKAKILAKLEELRTERQTLHDKLQDMSDEERRELKIQLHDDLKQWAEDNGIPLEYLHIKMHMKHEGGTGFIKHME
jgi:hypothetical protein